MLLRDAIRAFLSHRRLGGARAETLSLYDRMLGAWFDWRVAARLPDAVAAIEIAEVRRFFLYLRDERIAHAGNKYGPKAQRVGLAPATIESYHRVLRAFWSFLEAEDALRLEQTRFFQRGRIPRPHAADQARDAADLALVDALLAVEAATPEETARNRALILLLYETGLRVSELCGLTDADVSLPERSAKVLGKGGHFGLVFWSQRTADALSAYLPLRRGPLGGALLRGCSQRNDGGALTRDTVRALLKRLAARAGVALPAGSPVHCFRRGFVHASLDAGLDISAVAQLARHRSITTTMIYARRSAAHLKRQHERVFGASSTAAQQNAVDS